MFRLCFTEHTKAHALCLWPYIQKHLMFQRTHLTVDLLQAGRNEVEDQSSVPQGAVGGKSLTVGCWWWRPSIWSSVCEITYFVPLGSTLIHAVLTQILRSCVPWKTEKSWIWMLIVLFFFGKRVIIHIETSLFWWLFQNPVTFSIFFSVSFYYSLSFCFFVLFALLAL